MARTELPNGVILPAEYSDDWYEDMTSNLTKLDDVIGSDLEKLNADGVCFLRMSSAALTDGGTGNFSDLNSSYKIKTGDLVLDSGRKLYQVVSVDSTNETFTVGNSLFKVTAESDLAPVAESGDYDDLDNKPDLKPVATSGDYDDLTDLPTYGITRCCSSAISDNSSVAFSAISSTNKIKVGDFLLDTNGKMYQISSVDTANETVSVTTPLTQLAVDSGVIHNTGNETASGQKTLVNLLPLKGEYLGTETSNNARSLLYFLANRDTQNQSGIFLTKFRQNKAQGSMSGNDVAYLSFDCLENSVRTNNGLRINFLNFVDDIPQRFILWSGITEKLLGTDATPWSDVFTVKINSLNPGSLSFPDLNNGIDISGYFDAAQISTNTYTALADGYISLAVSSPNRGSINAVIGSDFWSTTAYGAVNPSDSNSFLQCMSIPILKNQTITVYLRTTGGTLETAKFYPCLGNV